jgi:hypothetical protein
MVRAGSGGTATMKMTELLTPTYRQMLQALSAWLNKAQEQMEGADALMAARLAPDMFPLSTQVRLPAFRRTRSAPPSA